jgi:hypothetical protein
MEQKDEHIYASKRRELLRKFFALRGEKKLLEKEMLRVKKELGVLDNMLFDE